MAKKKGAFGSPFIVFCPEGDTPPVVMHDTHQAAHATAWIMAKKHPGKQFLVMGRTGKGALLDSSAPPVTEAA